MPKGEGKLVAQNKKARHDYTIIDTIEAGIVLQGTEIKSIRNSRINLRMVLLGLEMARLSYTMCISALMSKEIFLIMTLFEHVNC